MTFAGLILCAGRGSRMQPLSDILPKPLLPIDGKPVIYHTVNSLLEFNLEGIGLVIHPEEKNVFERFLSRYFTDQSIDIFYQDNLTGIVTAIQTAEPYKAGDILVCAGDTHFPHNQLSKMINEINRRQSDIIIGIRERPAEDLLGRSIIVVNSDNFVLSTTEKPTKEQLEGISSAYSGVPIWYFPKICWQVFPDALPSQNGEYAVEGVIKEMQQQKGKVHAVEILGTRDITIPEDILLHNFDYVSKLLKD